MRLTLQLTLGSLLLINTAAAQESYKLPPDDVAKLIDSAVPPTMHMSPDRAHLLFLERAPLPSIQDISRRMLRLAGSRIDPACNGAFRTQYDHTIWYRPLEDADNKHKIKITVPKGARIGGVSWSHDSKNFVFTNATDEGTELYVSSVEHPDAPRLLTNRLNSVTGSPFDWMPDGKSLLCKLVPEKRGPEPAIARVPGGPTIQETSGNKSPVRTFQDLLTNASDEALYEYYATSQLAYVPIDGGAIRNVGESRIYMNVEPSPDGKQILSNSIHRPYSYLFPANEFPTTIEVLDSTGKQIYLVAEVPIAENIPIEGVRTGPRNCSWKTGEPATLLWVEALDGGDPRTKAEYRDKIITLASPFAGAPAEILKIQQRLRGIGYMQDPKLLTVTDYDRDKRWTRTRIYNTADSKSKPVVLDDRSQNDRYKDPGAILTRPDSSGRRVALEHEGYIYRSGAGATPNGERPMLSRQSVGDGKLEELWRCEEGCYESVVDVAAFGVHGQLSVITRHETPTMPPNYRMRGLGVSGNNINQITNDADPQPQIRGIKKQLVKYKRPDGVELSATLYTPADYKEGTRLPLVVWAYPLEFNDASTAGQVSGSPNRFTRIAGLSHLTFLTQGYAVMDNATMPIVGDPETMNDTFIEQVVASAKAAIDKAVEMGVADRNRAGVGGHSYGAFMTANLLAHCDLFKAGCARSGAYNRTLTPFGFQSERRSLWEAPKIYNDLSPFMFANKVSAPLLMIHGEADSNQGTFPIQSQRMFAALKGNGKTARLVLLPNEDHGYTARESVMHVQAEMIGWFDKYVKNAQQHGESREK
ncbi:MAG: S9 family peptidase [Planctomycetes bacterium]|nr:S9 family peptidase [Planctomycetota bacterium]